MEPANGPTDTAPPTTTAPDDVPPTSPDHRGGHPDGPVPTDATPPPASRPLPSTAPAEPSRPSEPDSRRTDPAGERTDSPAAPGAVPAPSDTVTTATGPVTENSATTTPEPETATPTTTPEPDPTPSGAVTTPGAAPAAPGTVTTMPQQVVSDSPAAWPAPPAEDDDAGAWFRPRRPTPAAPTPAPPVADSAPPAGPASTVAGASGPEPARTTGPYPGGPDDTADATAGGATVGGQPADLPPGTGEEPAGPDQPGDDTAHADEPRPAGPDSNAPAGAPAPSDDAPPAVRATEGVDVPSPAAGRPEPVAPRPETEIQPAEATAVPRPAPEIPPPGPANGHPSPPDRSATPEADRPSAGPAEDAVSPARAGSPGVPRPAAPPVAEEAPAPERQPSGGTRPAPDPRRPDDPRPDVRQQDPEQVLAGLRFRLDPQTLREEPGDPELLRTVRDRLTAKLGAALDNPSRARLLSLRAVVSRILGNLDDALADGRLALTYAEITGELRRTALARARLAQVLRWRGEYAEADRLYVEANSPELPGRLRAALHEHAARCAYDQGRFIEACDHFERALDLGHDADQELVARVRVGLDAVRDRIAAAGFGPFPRDREEILRSSRSPVPVFDGQRERWGYADADGELVIAGEYAEARPFHEGLAWVRRPEATRWALIDETGAVRIESNNGYRAVGPFSQGLAWVSMDGTGNWMAVDPTNIVQIPPGFSDVRPFSGGVAAVRRGGWGAVDRAGRLVVPTRHQGFVTALADGRPVDGFTEEGLAVVESDGRRGVVDRTGRVLVEPVWPALLIHPVAFLVADGGGRWGALDRRGEPLIDPAHPGRAEVLAEIDRLLADATPVL
ncbi:WG containing repeat-containing protein [Micromonospora siamensis]|uniref:WG containing repeat-containing protein n=1 Tax=Micromonospora siamensis TaxID=299152 RepID=A0A1C5JLM6_9ACTN|nr:WG containing repeat-containing protein [Micromonospora siamensis]